MRTGSLLACVFLTLVALLHLLRLAFDISAVAGGVSIPRWASVFGVLVPGGIAYLLWKESRTGA